MFERFTDNARRVVVLAQEEARMLGHNHIGSEHLLLGLIHETSGLSARVLAAAGVTLEDARAQVAELAGPQNYPAAGHIPFTRRAKTILEMSLREAFEQHKSYIGTEHIALGLIRDADGGGAQILERLAGPLPALRQRVLTEASTAPPEAAGAAEPEGTSPGAFVRAARVRAQADLPSPELISSIDRRLAGIERHLGFSSDQLGISLESIDRRLAVIGRHLGIDKPRPTAGEQPVPDDALPDDALPDDAGDQPAADE
jgi:ATP-dependent Clp protease ATP-binding subunit ClpA